MVHEEIPESGLPIAPWAVPDHEADRTQIIKEVVQHLLVREEVVQVGLDGELLGRRNGHSINGDTNIPMKSGGRQFCCFPCLQPLYNRIPPRRIAD